MRARMSKNAIQEFKDFMAARNEDEDTLRTRHGLIPDRNYTAILVKGKFLCFKNEDILRVLFKWSSNVHPKQDF
jgi:hypothetical protein